MLHRIPSEKSSHSGPMNHLAHFLLAEPHPLSRTGALLGDLVTGTPDSLLNSYPSPLVAAIVRHRWIDAYTHHHPSSRLILSIISPHRRRFAGPIADVLFDHLLVRTWPQFSPLPLRHFIESCYEDLRQSLPLLPIHLASDISQRITADWLSQYHSTDSLREVFTLMSHRSPRFTPLLGAEQEWQLHPQAFEKAFSLLWPDLITAIHQLGPESSAIPTHPQNHLASPEPPP